MENDVVDRPNYVLTAVRWSRQNPTASSSSSSVSSSNASSAISSFASSVSSATSKTVGHPHLHRGFAVTFWNGENFEKANIYGCSYGCVYILYIHRIFWTISHDFTQESRLASYTKVLNGLVCFICNCLSVNTLSLGPFSYMRYKTKYLSLWNHNEQQSFNL